MAEVKTIKGVDDETWADFKSLAAKNSQSVGSFFNKLITFYKKESKTFWDDILEGKPTLSKKEAEDLYNETILLRKERGFRDDFNF
tara:strand:+ start:471 stop:728 length:258 start_codon:yes stop_codon:yes gene_type:complete